MKLKSYKNNGKIGITFVPESKEEETLCEELLDAGLQLVNDGGKVRVALVKDQGDFISKH